MTVRFGVLAAVCALSAAGVATAATVGTGPSDHQVALTATGPQPADSPVAWGDTVVFTNTSGATLRFAIPRLQVSTDIPAGGTLTQKFTLRGGSYRLLQVAGKERHTGSVTVSVTGAVAVKATPASVPFGKEVTLTGSTPYGDAPVSVTMRDAQGATKTLATPTTLTDGSFSTRLMLSRGGRVVVTAAGGQLRSNRVAITVVPRVAVTAAPHKPKPGTFVKVRAVYRPADAASRAFLDVWVPLRKRWQSNKSAPVNSSGVVTFSLRVAKGETRMRVRVSSAGRQAGYAAVTTKPVSVTAK